MTATARGLVLTLVLALLAPGLAPLLRGSSLAADGCACQTRCCRTSQRPSPAASPCHGARPAAPSCSMRCNHPNGQTPLAAASVFLLEADTGAFALVLRSDAPHPFRPETRTGFDRIESPPPRPLLLAI